MKARTLWSWIIAFLCGVAIGFAISRSLFADGYEKGKADGERLVIFRERSRLLLPGSTWKRVDDSTEGSGS